MKAIDTNILIRFLIRDDEQQAKLVRRRLKNAEAEKEVLFVPLLVVIETIWVLESVYQVSKEDILDSFDELLLLPVLLFESSTVLQAFVASGRETTIDLSDLLIAHSAKASGCQSVLTFDQKASKSDFFEKLT